MTIEYRVKRVERFIVTRYESARTSLNPGTLPADNAPSSVRQVGKEFDSFDTAYEVGYALARADQERLGLSVGDKGVIFPSKVLEDARAA